MQYCQRTKRRPAFYSFFPCAKIAWAEFSFPLRATKVFAAMIVGITAKGVYIESTASFSNFCSDKMSSDMMGIKIAADALLKTRFGR